MSRLKVPLHQTLGQYRTWRSKHRSAIRYVSTGHGVASTVAPYAMSVPDSAQPDSTVACVTYTMRTLPLCSTGIAYNASAMVVPDIA
eukprot:308305-Rhodomonas_salina.3